MKKNTWNVRHLVEESFVPSAHRPSEPAYYIVDCRIYEGALGFLKVTVFVSVRRVKSLLPPKSHRSLSTHAAAAAAAYWSR